MSLGRFDASVSFYQTCIINHNEARSHMCDGMPSSVIRKVRYLVPLNDREIHHTFLGPLICEDPFQGMPPRSVLLNTLSALSKECNVTVNV